MTVRKRGDVWHYQFMVKGQMYYGVLPDARNKTDAKVLEAEERVSIRKGARQKPKDLDRFQKFVKEVFLKNSEETKRSYRHDRFRCEMLCEYFGSRRFDEITPMQVASFIKQRLATKIKRHRQKSEATLKRSPVTVHKEVTLLSSIFRMAIGEQVATQNPVTLVPKAVRKMIKARRRRRCTLDYEKEERLLSQGLVGRCAHLRPVVLFDLHTGLRWGELSNLKREHVNLSDESVWFDINGESYELPPDCLIVLRGKNGRPRVIPLNSQAKAVAEHQLNDATVGEYLFSSNKTDGQIKEVKKGFASACEAAGIKYGLYDSEGVTFHTLRHWFNTKLEDHGVSKTVRRDLLGHSAVDITDDYTHSTIDMRRKAVELLCHKKLEGVASSKPTVAKLWQAPDQGKAVSLSY